MSTVVSSDLISLVENLRREQEFSTFYKTQIRQTIQDINHCCDQVFQSLWFTQYLCYMLEKTKLHQIQCVEWTWALEQMSYVKFVNAAKILRSNSLVASYNKFLGALLEKPALLARVLVWAESEGRDSTAIISDLLSVVYGHCVFQRDHTLFLDLLRELMNHLVSAAASPKEVFSGVEPIFCRVLTEYCNQLSTLQTFVTEAFMVPLGEVLLYEEEYLEFDVSKAGTRFQNTTETSGTEWLVDGSVFLFGEDLDSSCVHLANLATQFIDSLFHVAGHFPLSLKWVLGCLKSLIRDKWPDISPTELRRPISSLLFGPILGSTLVNPDCHGVCEMDIVVGPVARYNLSQVATILEGCAWMLERQGGNKFPMHKVIKKMNTTSYCKLLDSLDDGYGKEPLDIPSSLPGLRRTVYLTSQTQLNNMVGLVCEVADHLTRRSISSPLRDGIAILTQQMPQSMKQMASTSPYSTTSPSLSPLRSNRSPTKSLRHSDMIDGVATATNKSNHRKRVSVDAFKTPVKPSAKKRSSSTSNLNQILMEGGGGGHSSSTRIATRSISPNRIISTHNDAILRSPPGGRNLTTINPSEVLIFPISIDSNVGCVGVSRSTAVTALWDFALLTQDEFMQQHTMPPPTTKKDNSPSTDPTPHTPPSSTTPIPQPSTHPSSSTEHTTNIHTSNPTVFSSTEHTSSSLTHTNTTSKTQDMVSETSSLSYSHSPIPDIPNGPINDGMESSHVIQNGMRSGSNSTNSVCSPVREQWDRRLRGSHTGTETKQLQSTGSDSSLNACMSSREPSSSPQTIPKKRSFTITSIENGKFALDVDLISLRHRIAHPELTHLTTSPPSHLPSNNPPSPLHIITHAATPLSPPSITSPPSSHYTNGVDNPSHTHPSTPSLNSPTTLSSNSQQHYSNGPQSKHELSPSNPDLSASDHDRPSSDADAPPSDVSSTPWTSVENILEETPNNKGGVGGKEGGKKKKWRFKRKKKNKMKSQASLPEETTDYTVEVKKRSKSNIITQITDSPLRSEPPTQRSSTHDIKSSAKQQQQDVKEGSALKKRRSNTIIEKYRAIVDEQKRKKVPPIVKEKLDSLPRFVNISFRDMSPDEFKESLFCTQLEYKLRAALQNVHTPLNSSPVYHQLIREDGDSKIQLTALLRCALQRSKWIHSDMETALLSETLRMIDQIPNTLVSVALTTAHEEQHKRKAYTNYLVESHMKFLDVRLQVGAIQTAVDRYQEILKEQFVQFAVRQFLELQAEQLAEFQRSMVSLPLADERCSLMIEKVELLTETLLEDQTWKHWPRVSVKVVTNYLEDQLYSTLYPHVFQPNMELDRQKDELYSSHLSTLSQGLTPTHRSLQISPIYHSGCPWPSAQKHLKAMAMFKSPRGKVHCIAESCRVLISLLQYAKVGSPPGADDLFPVLVYVLIKANPPGLLSTTQYIKNFLEDHLVGEENYWWVQFSTAIEFTKTLE